MMGRRPSVRGTATQGRRRMQASGWRRQSLPLLLLGLTLWLQFQPPQVLQRPLQRLEGMLYDAKVQHLPPWPRSVSNIQIVDIDEASLQAIGRMPWDRRQFAALTTALADAGAVLIVFDLLFAEAQPNPAQLVLQHWPQAQPIPDNLRSSLQAVQPALDGDQQFADALSRTEVVLAHVLHQQAGQRSGQLNVHSVEQGPQAAHSVLRPFAGYAAPLPLLAKAAKGQGFINAQADADGFIRRLALVQPLDGQLYPALALEAFRVYSLLDHIRPAWLSYSAAQGASNKQSASSTQSAVSGTGAPAVQSDGLSYLQGVWLGNVLINTDQQGRLLIPFRGGARHYPYTSAADVLQGRIRDRRFDQAVVFVGTSAAGLADLRATPMSQTFPGIEIHATVFDGLMSPDTLPYRPDWWQAATLLQMLLLAVFCLWLFPGLSAVAMLASATLLLLSVAGADLLLWRWQALDLPLLGPLLLGLSLSLYYIAAGFIQQTRQRLALKSLFGQYLPPAHLERLLQDPAAISLTGEKKQLTVLFCDIRGFTSIAESMSAQQLKLWLNQYFSALTAAILAHGGTIDKYVGDMVMAFWGAPLDEPAHARRALLAALAMQQALSRLNQQFAAQGQPKVCIGMGINSGEMNVGDMGSDFRRSYTVIGDAVNLASRLEGLTKFYGLPLLVGEDCQAQASGLDFLLVDLVRVKGKQRPQKIYLPLAAVDASLTAPACQQLADAIAAYLAADLSAALALLQQAAADLPAALQPLAALYQRRLEHLVRTPPAADWDGCFDHLEK